MKEILKNIGLSEKTIDNMIRICESIRDLNSLEVQEKIDILKQIKCNNIQIRDIISSNPIYLNLSDIDVIELIKKLQEFGFTNLNLLFEGNPYILNLSSFEIEEYINDRLQKGEYLKDIVDDMSSNLYIFDEI